MKSPKEPKKDEEDSKLQSAEQETAEQKLRKIENSFISKLSSELEQGTKRYFNEEATQRTNYLGLLYVESLAKDFDTLLAEQNYLEQQVSEFKERLNSSIQLFEELKRNINKGILEAEASDESPSLKTLTLEGPEFQRLTPQTLVNNISPFLIAVGNLQNTIDKILGKESHEVSIKVIRQFSPISVSLEGAAEAVQVMQNSVIPWRRKHAETMARLLEQEKLCEIEYIRADVLDKRASAAKSRAEADKMSAEAKKLREEAEKLKLENDKFRLELDREKILLATEILNQLSAHLSDTERNVYIAQLLQPLNTIILSNFQVIGAVSSSAGYRLTAVSRDKPQEDQKE